MEHTKISKEYLDKVRAQVNQYYENDEIDVELANSLANRAYWLADQYANLLVNYEELKFILEGLDK